MVTRFYVDVMQWVNKKIETRFFHSAYWMVYIVFLAICISFFFSFPRFDSKFIHDGHWDIILKQAKGNFLDPSIFADLPRQGHEAKRYYRITLPLIVRLFHLNITGMLVLQFFLTTLNYYLFARFIYNLTANKRVTTYLLFASSLVFSYRLGFNEVWGHFDILPLLLLTVSMSFKKYWVVFLSLFFACWSDERAVLAAFITLLFWYQEDGKFLNRQVVSGIVAIVSYALIRVTIRVITGYETPMQNNGVGPECLIYTVPIFIPELLRSLEGFWLLVLLYLYALKTEHHKILFYSVLVVLTATLLGSLLVFDIFRSLAYLTPLIYVCLYKLKNSLSEKFSFFILICCFVYPSHALLFNDNLMVSGNLAVYEIGRIVYQQLH